MKIKRKIWSLCGSASSCVALISSGAQAQDIVVTAQKREQSLQEVPIAITSIGGEDLKSAGFQNLEDLAGRIPSLQLQDNGVVARFSMRGINLNSISDASESPIQVMYDGVPYGSSSNFSSSMFDLERIEVLRGPQGTLYGRNSTGGLVNIITRRPTSQFEGYVSAQYGSFGRRIFEGAVGGPVTDSVRFRISAKTDTDDGIQRNIIDDETWWKSDTISARAQLEFDIDDATLLVRGHYSDMEGIGPGYGLFGNREPDSVGYALTCSTADTLAGLCVSSFGTQGTNDPRLTISANTPPPASRSDWGVSAELTYPIGDTLTLVSISAYDELEKFRQEDADASADAPNTISSGNDYGQFSQELRLQGESDRLNWVAGMFYFWSHAHVTSGFGFYPGPQNDLGYSDVGTDSYAAFADGSYRLTDQLSLSLGVRFTHEEKTHSGLNLAPAAFPFISPDDPVPFDFTSSDDVITWRAVLDYKPTDDLMLYGMISTGFKAPGFQTQFLLTTDPFAAAASEREEVTTYEMGIKSSWLDRSLYLNLAGYYSDYKGLQQVLTVPTPLGVNTPVLTNVEKAELYGLEADVTFTPSPYFDLIAGGSYLHTRIIDPGSAFDGNVVSAAPEWSYSVTARGHLPLGSEGELTLQASYRWQDQVYFNLSQNPLQGSEAYGVLDLRLILNPPRLENLTLEAFANNVTDKEYWVHAFGSGAIGGGTVGIWGMPRTYGVRARFDF